MRTGSPENLRHPASAQLAKARRLEQLGRLAEMIDAAGAAAIGREADEQAQQAGLGVPWAAADGRTGLQFRRGTVHEWLGVEDGAAEAINRRPLAVLIDLAWRALSATAQRSSPGIVVWIGRRCWPHPRSLVRPGSAGLTLLERSIFVQTDDPPPAHTSSTPGVQPTRDATRSRHGVRQARRAAAAARLWAIELALRNQAVDMVVADGLGLDMSATRRLQLTAESSRGLAMLASPPHQLHELSAAACRWRVEPLPRMDPDAIMARSPHAFDMRRHADSAGPSRDDPRLMPLLAAEASPPQPRWRLTLLRARPGAVTPLQQSPDDCSAEPSAAGRPLIPHSHTQAAAPWNAPTGMDAIAFSPARPAAPAVSADSKPAAAQTRLTTVCCTVEWSHEYGLVPVPADVVDRPSASAMEAIRTARRIA